MFLTELILDHTLGVMIRFVAGLLMMVTLLVSFPLTINAQTAPTNINLEIPFVNSGESKQATTKTGSGTWEYKDQTLTLDDAIRYGWKGVDLNTKYVNTPALSGGYLKVYLGSRENFLFDYGSSPLPINELGESLVNGENTVIFVFYNANGETNTTAQITFNFENSSSEPAIKVISPEANTIFTEESEDVTFEIELSNFTLENRNSNQPNKGKMSLYYNQKTSQNFLGTFDFSKAIDDQRSLVTFNGTDVGLDKIPDSKDTELIFVLTNIDGSFLPYEKKLNIVSNYQGTINVGLPSVTIAEPAKGSSELNIDGKRAFILQIENFEILSKYENDERANTGYLQIYVDNTPIKNRWSKAEFTLNEIGYAPTNEGRKTIRVELVDQEFNSLNPRAEDSIDIFYQFPEIDDSETALSVDSSNWRVIIIILVILVIVGAIGILITKG